MLKSSFPPIAGPQTRLLVLGSLPGEMSLQRGQYYANPRNQFWRLMEVVIGVPLPEAYESRLEALAAAGVGLWDVVRSARRAGSLDAAIRGHEPNALPELARRLPLLRAVGFNGGAAARIGMPVLAARQDLALVALPSSSPAYTLPFERKLAAWLQLRPFLHG